jgi:transposase
MSRNKSTDKVRATMAMVHSNAAAIDVGATMHMAAVNADRTAETVRSFDTFTTDLHRLEDWYAECGVDTVVMESTSVYWIPILSSSTPVALGSSSSMRAMPSTYLRARPMSVTHSCCSGSTPPVCCAQAFGPEVRSPSCVPTCVSVSACLSMGRRISMQKALTEMNVQLHHVVTDITGAIGLRIIRAILGGERNPAVLARMRDRRCHATVGTIEKALAGNYRSEHLFALEQALALYDT